MTILLVIWLAALTRALVLLPVMIIGIIKNLKQKRNAQSRIDENQNVSLVDYLLHRDLKRK